MSKLYTTFARSRDSEQYKSIFTRPSPKVRIQIDEETSVEGVLHFRILTHERIQNGSSNIVPNFSKRILFLLKVEENATNDLTTTDFSYYSN